MSPLRIHALFNCRRVCPRLIILILFFVFIKGLQFNCEPARVEGAWK